MAGGSQGEALCCAIRLTLCGEMDSYGGVVCGCLIDDSPLDSFYWEIEVEIALM